MKPDLYGFTREVVFSQRDFMDLAGPADLDFNFYPVNDAGVVDATHILHFFRKLDLDQGIWR